MDLTPPTQTRAETTELVLGVVFTTLGMGLLAIGLWQLSSWMRGAATGPTIEPIVIPVGLVFVAAGIPKVLRVLRLRALARDGVDADADVLAVEPTGKSTDGQPWVKVELRVHAPGREPTSVRLTWLLRPIDRLIVGNRVRVRVLPARPHVVGLR